jgi:UDP-N-acetylglucosamine 2-epimerase (non-hydrolysing)
MRSTPRPHPARIAIVAGTRPECLKTAAVVRAFAAAAGFDVHLVNSGQHRELVESTFAHLGLAPNHVLPALQNGLSLSRGIRHLRGSLRDAFGQIAPRLVLVQGDTSTAYAGALAARDLRLPLAHVEAGLRTGDPMRPFPEEPFRRRIAPLADWHFAPTPGAAANLLSEGVPQARVHVVGNTIIDELRLALSSVKCAQDGFFPASEEILTLTLHRRENYGRGLDLVCDAVLEVLARRPGLAVVCPVHPNPTVGNRIRRLLGGQARVRLVEPMPYRPFVRLLQASALVVTDSGGIQEEAPYLGVPVLVARDATERPEALATGGTRLVPLHRDAIVAAIDHSLASPRPAPLPFSPAAPFGDGHSGARIVAILGQAIGIATNSESLPEPALQSA